jgi:hypothetical protein
VGGIGLRSWKHMYRSACKHTRIEYSDAHRCVYTYKAGKKEVTRAGHMADLMAKYDLD